MTICSMPGLWLPCDGRGGVCGLRMAAVRGGPQLRGGLARVPHQLQRGHHCRGHAGLTDNDDDNDNDTVITGDDNAGDMLRGLASLRD